MLALGWFLDSAVREAIQYRTATVYGDMTNVMFRMASDFLVQPQDFATGEPMTPERQANVNALLTRLGASDESVRVAIADNDGRILYANRRTDVAMGNVRLTDAVRKALGGERSTSFTSGSDSAFSAGSGRMVEIYLPVRFGDDPKVHGIIMASGLDGSLINDIDNDIRRMKTSLFVGIVALWLALMPISSSLSRRLRRKSEENEYLALHDTLTGLPNRNLLAAALAREIDTAQRSGSGIGLLLIDLDRFKEVNDTLGHGKGDDLLVAVATRLNATVRSVDTVARLGGDEFAIIVHGARTAADLEEVAQRVTVGLTGATDIGGIDIAVQASIGGAVYPAQANDAEELLQHADIAMYAAKDGGQPFALYSANLDSHSPSRLALAAEFVKALASNEFVLHFQPVASPIHGHVEAMEALVRWNHPTRGLLPPCEFIPLAEQSGLVRQLTTKVLDLAIAECARWRAEGHDIAVAVNLSANDLRTRDLSDEVAQILQRHNLPAHALELEVTETALLDAPDTAAMVVASLRALGIRIALDDFGTGYSSLTYLKQLRPDRLKIDRSFVNAMTREAADGEIVRSVIGLAHSLSIGVTAEGVETEEHWGLLGELACDLVQGYFLSRPMSASAAMLWLEQRQALSDRTPVADPTGAAVRR